MMLAVAAVGAVCVVAAIALMGRVEGDATRASELLVSSDSIPPPPLPTKLHPRRFSRGGPGACLLGAWLGQCVAAQVSGVVPVAPLGLRQMGRWAMGVLFRWSGAGGDLNSHSGTSAFTEVPQGAPRVIQAWDHLCKMLFCTTAVPGAVSKLAFSAASCRVPLRDRMWLASSEHSQRPPHPQGRSCDGQDDHQEIWFMCGPRRSSKAGSRWRGGDAFLGGWGGRMVGKEMVVEEVIVVLVEVFLMSRILCHGCWCLALYVGRCSIRRKLYKGHSTLPSLLPSALLRSTSDPILIHTVTLLASVLTCLRALSPNVFPCISTCPDGHDPTADPGPGALQDGAPPRAVVSPREPVALLG